MQNNPQGQQPLTVDQAEHIVNTFEALERLELNPDFQLVFHKHLFTDEVIRLHGLMAHPDAVMIDSRDGIIKDMDAISGTKFMLQMIRQTGTTTRDSLNDFRAAEMEDLAEETEGE